jgi:hypothetical protein
MKAIYPMVTDKYNLYSNTENLSTGWLTTNSSVTASNVAGPFTASLVANRLNESSGSSISPTIYQTVALTSGSLYVMSVYARWNNRDYLVLNPDGNSKTWFDIRNGFVSSSQGTVATASITRVSGTASNPSGSWYRCAMVFTSSVSTPYNTSIQVANTDGSLTYDSLTGLSGSFLWGAQFEPGSFISPYVSNTTNNAYTTASIFDQFKFNLKDPRDSDSAFRITFSGSWTPAYSGNRPDGLTAIGDTKLNVSASLRNGNSHITFYTRTNTVRATGGSYNEMDFGAYNGSDFLAIWTKRAGEAGFILSNPTSNDGQQFGGLGGSGYYILTDNSTPSLPKFYIKNSQITGGSFFSQGSTLPNSTVRFGQIQGNYSDKEASFATVGDGLTDYEAKALYWIVQKYQTTLGRQVY